MIDWDKPVMQRNGRAVLIYTTTGRCSQPVVGEREWNSGWELDDWTLNGEWDEEANGQHEYDLVNVPQEHTMWVNVYSRPGIERYYHAFRGRPGADSSASHDMPATDKRIACVEVTYTEGEGLESRY